MKKLLTVLLGVSVLLSACGKDTSDDKKAKNEEKEQKEEVLTTEEIVEKFNDLSWKEIEKLFSDADYVEFEDENAFIKSDDIKGDVVDMDKFYDLIEGDEFSFHYVLSEGGDNTFYAADMTRDTHEIITYEVGIDEGDAKLAISYWNSDDESYFFDFVFEDGELVLDEDIEDLDDDEIEMLEKHEKKAKKFFEDAIEELYSVIG